jgi:hypothetical protein
VVKELISAEDFPEVQLLHRKRGGRGTGKRSSRIYKIPTECRLPPDDLAGFRAQIFCDFGKDMGLLMKTLAETQPDYFNLLLMDPPWHVTKVARAPKVLIEWDKVTFPHYCANYHLLFDPHVIIQIVTIFLENWSSQIWRAGRDFFFVYSRSVMTNSPELYVYFLLT